MSDKPVNLNRFRKEKVRAEKRARADANAAKFGRPKSQRVAEERENAQITRLHEGHALQKPDSSTE